MTPDATPGLPFAKMSGGGNDFILLDERRTPAGQPGPDLARALCRRAHSVGADGLIVVGPSNAADLAMVYFNADGSRTFCGNGALCTARWAHSEAGLPPELRLETDVGILSLRVRGGRVEMQVPSPGDWRVGVALAPAGLEGEGIHLNTGCPHLVVLGSSLPDDGAFAAAAPILRRHPDLGDAGANVDFVAVEDPHHLALRTFERGVERETLASGTGCLAAALAAASRSLVVSPVTCLPRGGQALTVRFRGQGPACTDISLEGMARLIYTGLVEPGAFTAG